MLISVVIPVFNRRDCVSRAIASALKLGDRLAEVVVVDDGSTDGSADVVRENFAAEVTRGKVILHRLVTNSGVTAAKNAGAALSSGEWIAFLDSDDYLLEDSIAEMVRDLEAADGKSLVFFRCIDSSGKLLGEASLRSASISVHRYLRQWHWGECLPVVRARVFGQHQYDPSLRGFEGLAYARMMRAQPDGAWVSAIVARAYDTERTDRISTSRGKLARACRLSRGHWRLLAEFPRELGLTGCALSILKVGYYALLCCAWAIARGARQMGIGRDAKGAIRP